MEWTPVAVFPVSGLSCSAATAWAEDEADGEVAHVLRLSFVGEYRHGSAGNPDADFMVAATAAALALEQPGALVLDLTEMRYRWGNRLLNVFEAVAAADAQHPIAAVLACGPDSLPAVTSLLGGRSDWLHDNLDDAVEHATRLAFLRSRAIG